MIRLITIQQDAEWQETVRSALFYDYYHTWYYNSIADDGEPVLLKYSDGNDFIAIPLLKRPIPNTEFYDMTSVYGYAGPISNKPFCKIHSQMKESFKQDLEMFLSKNNYVSVFTRLNPFLDQLSLMNNFNGVHDTGKIVVIDLRESLEQQHKKYESGLLRKIQKLRTQGFAVKEAETIEDVKAFAGIYRENMRSVGAADFYMFDEDYFQRMLRSTEFDCRLMMVYHNSIPVCGATIVCTQKIMQSHLLGTLDSYKKFSPAKLLTEEITLLGRKQGMEFFNLGGGYGFKEDSLFYFKSAFSDLSIEYKSWRYVVNEQEYTRLVLNADIDADNDVDFFPLYRYKCAEETVSRPAMPASTQPVQLVEKVY